MLIEPSFERDDLAKLFGSTRSRSLSRSVVLKLKKLRPTFEQLMMPRLHYKTKMVSSINKKEVTIEGGHTFRSSKLSKAMKDCESLICFIATIGSGVDKEIARLTGENRLSLAYLLDSLGSVAVENVAEGFHQSMKAQSEAIAQGVTYRFSPGYCDWPITEQKGFFKLFDSEKTGVRLLDSCLMWPRKSISGVFGIYNDTEKVPYNPCRDCLKKNCKARRI
ncbi:MAG TPA: vitamin B12 dependent-methionine synthase activation domain-containing protein [Desulfatiglandales bacterium]|nr:vitamin B12 dependent-methionine synthase activation domain-containing protein [Desulfatiglandales bacterium]